MNIMNHRHEPDADVPDADVARLASAAREASRTAITAGESVDAAVRDAVARGATVHELAAWLALPYETAERISEGELRYTDVLLAGMKGRTSEPCEATARRRAAFENAARRQEDDPTA